MYSLKELLSQETPPDAESWNQLRAALIAVNGGLLAQAETETPPAALTHVEKTVYEEFRRVFLDGSVAQVLTGADDIIFDVNTRAAEIIGMPRERLVGKNVNEIRSYVDSEQRAQMIEIFAREGRVRDVEVEIVQTAGRHRLCIMNWDRLNLHGSQFVLATFFDVTELKETETQLRTLHRIAERQARESALLDRARTVLTRSVDLSTLVREIVDEIVMTFGYGLVSLYLIENNALKIQHYYGYVDVLANISLDKGIMARSVRIKQPILLTDVHADPDFLGMISGVVSEIAVPLLVNDEVVGVLNVESTDSIPLNEEDLKVMIALSEHISLAIQRAQLFNILAESERREREQRLFAEALRDTAAGLNATQNLEMMIDLIIKQLKHVMPPFQAARVLFIQGKQGRIVAQPGYPDDAFASAIPLEAFGCLPDFASPQRTCLFTDTWEQLGQTEGTPMAWVRSLIGASVTFNERVIGVIYLDSDQPNTFQAKHADLLRAFADQAGIALQKAQLYKRLRRQTKMRMRQAMEYERRVSEMRAQFGIAISHEFRTPLTTIHTSADLLRLYDDRLTPERRSELLGKIKSQVKHLTHLLEDIMLLSRSDLIGVQVNRNRTDLDHLCQESAGEIQWIAGYSYRIQFVGDGKCQDAYIDADLMRRVFINLLTNAVKYSPEGGSIMFTLKREGDEAVIEVSDNGIGIPEHDIERLFETFHRAGNVGSIPGTGLGLALVKQAVELHQGTIEVKSAEGVGSTFTLRLPIVPTPPDHPAESA